MPLYHLSKHSIAPVQTVRFAEAGVRERGDLQRLLREKIDVISPNTLIIAEEFGEWEESRRRIDLLGVDSGANLVVIELKRTEDGGHMDLQAVRYAAMISTLTFERVVELLAEHLAKMGQPGDARSLLLERLGWGSADDGEFAPSVRIVLAAADFGKELTTSVLWLNDQGLDIRCVRLAPYRFGEDLLVDVQQVLPLAEATDYMIQIRAKRQEARQAQRTQQRDFSKFVLTLGGEELEPLNKRRAMLEVVRYLVAKGAAPAEIVAALPENERNRRFITVAGVLNRAALLAHFAELQSRGERIDYSRYFHEENELLHHAGSTSILSKMWGTTTEHCLGVLAAAFPQRAISIERVG